MSAAAQPAPDRSAELTALIERDRPMLLRVSRRFSRHGFEEDVLQSALLKAWRHIQTFDGRSSIKSWLCRIIRHQAVDEFRNASRGEQCGWAELNEHDQVFEPKHDNSILIEQLCKCLTVGMNRAILDTLEGLEVSKASLSNAKARIRILHRIIV